MTRPNWWRSLLRRRLSLRDAVVFTIPLLGLLAFVILASVGDYRTTQRFDDWWSAQVRLRDIFAARRVALDSAASSAA